MDNIGEQQPRSNANDTIMADEDNKEQLIDGPAQRPESNNASAHAQLAHPSDQSEQPIESRETTYQQTDDNFVILIEGNEMIESADTTPTPASQCDLFQQIAHLIQSNTELLKSEIKAEIQSNNSELKAEIQSNNSNLKAEIQLNNSDLKSEIKSTNQSLKTFIEQINYKITELSQSNELIKADLNNVRENQNHLTAQFKQLEIQVEEQINVQINDVRKDFTKDLNCQNNAVQSQIQQVLSNIKSTNEDTNQNIEQHAHMLDEIKHTLNTQTDHIETLEEKLNKQSTALPTSIQVTCTGGNTTIDQPIPKFHGRMHNPKEYLIKLRRYYEKTLHHRGNQDVIEHLHEVIESSLENHASRWFELIKSNINKWQDFQEAFEQKYWSYEVQRAIRQRLEIERYRPNGKLSRAEYFVERVLLLRSTTPTPTEEEIVTCLADHFSELIQDARRVQNVTTITGFEQLLQREDLKDAHQRSRNNYQPSNNHVPNNAPQPPFNQRPPPPHNPPPRNHNGQYHNHRNQHQYNNNYRNNSGQPYQNNHRTNFNQKRPYSPNYNNQHHSQGNPNYRNRSPPRDRRYPTPEQHEVCHTIAETSPRDNTTPNNTSLND